MQREGFIWILVLSKLYFVATEYTETLNHLLISLCVSVAKLCALLRLT
jgi:hypothetical protein